MPLSKTTYDELNGAKEALRSEVDRLDAEIFAKQKERSEKATKLDAMQKILADENPQPLLQSQNQESVHEIRINPENLTESISAVLVNTKVPTKPVAITEILRSAGFKDEGKTPLTVRVNSELYRMMKKNIVGREPNGYRLTNQH